MITYKVNTDCDMITVILQQHDRYPGRLILLDGATGQSLGRYMEMPDSREMYMSPVLHTRGDGAQYILFGHGGETISGLWINAESKSTNALLKMEIIDEIVWFGVQ